MYTQIVHLALRTYASLRTYTYVCAHTLSIQVRTSTVDTHTYKG